VSGRGAMDVDRVSEATMCIKRQLDNKHSNRTISSSFRTGLGASSIISYSKLLYIFGRFCSVMILITRRNDPAGLLKTGREVIINGSE
jgi:hypothetical protein